MKLLISTLIFGFIFAGCSATWEGIKDDSSENWEKTKDGTSEAYEATKEAIHDATK